MARFLESTSLEVQAQKCLSLRACLRLFWNWGASSGLFPWACFREQQYCWNCCTETAGIVAQSSFHAHFHINLIYNHTSNVLTEYFGNQSISLINQAWWLSLKGFMNSTHSSQLFYCWKSIPVGGRNFERSVSKMHFLLWNELTFVPVLWVSQSFKLLQFLLLFLNS